MPTAVAQQESLPQNQNKTQDQPPHASMSQEPDNTCYPVGKLLKSKFIKGIKHYLVRWADKSSRPSWEPTNNVTHSLKEQFHINMYKTSRKRNKKR